MGRRRRVGGALAVLAGVGVLAALALAPAAAGPDDPGHPARLVAATSDPPSSSLAVAVAADPATGGYWIATADGAVFSFGAAFFGSMGGTPLVAPIVGMAATADGRGYWLVASDGGVFAFGDAGFSGSMGGQPLNQPIVGMAADPVTGGYWLVASDGGIFSFDAPFEGSTGGLGLVRPVVGMATTHNGAGYWLVAADGGIFAFGNAPFEGSMGGAPLAYPIVGMAADPATGGYREVALDGGIFAFGAPFAGSVAGLGLNRGMVSMASAPDGGGYWLLGADGGLFALGGAPYLGAVAVLPLVGQVVTIDPGHDGGNGANPDIINQPIDGGGFTETCDTAGTETADGYTEHAFNFDVAVRAQAALEAEGATVILTRPDDTGVGPCVNVRAAIGNDAHSDAAISIHADGGPVGGRGFTVIEPAPVVSSISDNRAIVAPSVALGALVRNAFLADTGEQTSDYDGQNGVDVRNNLGGLNLSTVPKVLIECANMQNPTDAALTESPQWRQSAAQGISDGITQYLVATLRVP